MTAPPASRPREVWLLAATFLVAAAGMIYELIAATLSSYLLGDSVRQFSLVIGVFLASMGLGAWLSRFVAQALPGFVWAQIWLGLLGGFLAPVLWFSYAAFFAVGLPLYGFLVAIGILAGMEIPLIARILKEIGAPQFRFENVLSVDYVGALAASLAFPLLIVPYLGLMSASLAFGCLNLLVAGLSLWLFRDRLSLRLWLVWGAALAVSVAALTQAERMVTAVEAGLFEDEVILSEDSPYQQITLTRFRDRLRLFLDYSIQFDTLDEYRYHEMLVHPAMSLAPRARTVLILGGGDGMAAREVFRHQGVETVTLVDLDARVTDLFSRQPELTAVNGNSLNDPRLTVVTEDAWKFVETSDAIFDVVIVDLPDPKSIALSKLYTAEFYALLADRIGPGGIIVVQSGSPLFARQAFWSVVHTLAATRNPGVPGGRLAVLPYHVHVPSFGEWGFAIATLQPLQPRPLTLPEGLRYLTGAAWDKARVFAADEGDTAAEVNRIATHPLVGYYNAGWDYWFR
jgi:spermidine synthase